MTTDPFHRPGALAHQREAFERFRDAPHFALWFDPRCRKSATTLAIWRHHVERGHVDALIVLGTPSGVKWVWAEEVRSELPPDMLAATRIIVWEAGRTSVTRDGRALLDVRAHAGPVLLAMNCESVLTEDGDHYVEWLLRRRRCMLVTDEDFMTRWSARTKRVLAYSRRPNARVKAVLSGTPVDESPLEIYYPAKFLRDGLLGYADKAVFTARYSEYEVEEVEETLPNGMVIKRQLPAGKRFNAAKLKLPDGSPNPDPYDRFPIFKRYRNLDELRERMFAFGMRVRKEDVSDAPPKQYVSEYFELSPRQAEAYEKLHDEYAIDLARGRVTARDVLLRMTRLQMICRNYWPPERRGVPCPACGGLAFTDDGEDCPACEGLGARVETTELERIDPDASPAIDALLAAVAAVPQPFVVWCRFRQDVGDVADALSVAGHYIVEHHGGIPDAIAEGNYQAFKAGGLGAPAGIVGTVAGGLSRGKDLSRATLSIFYSNDFKLRLRRQAEERTEGLLRTVGTTVVDLIAAGTRDQDVIDALRAKRNLAAVVMGDPRPWFGGDR